jgi:ATP-binding cassette subfamily C protein LapB
MQGLQFEQREYAEAQEEGGDELLDSLLAVARLHGLAASPHTARAGLPLEQGALTPSVLPRAAQRLGMSARVVQRPLERITALSVPAILLLRDNQACVLLDPIADTRVRVLQPESGDGESDLELVDLQALYTGYAVFLRPGHRYDDRTPPVRGECEGHWFWGTLSESWRLYRDVLLASLLINLFALASPLFVMNVYDRVVPNNAIETLWVLAAGVSVVYLFDFVLRSLRGYFIDLAGRKGDVVLSARLFERVLGMRLNARPASVGAFAGNLREFDSIRDFFTSATITTLVDLPFAILFFLVIYLIGGPLVVVPLVVVPLLFAYGFAIQPALRRAAQHSFVASSKKNAVLVESLNGIEAVKLLGSEGRAQRMWEEAVADIAKSSAHSRLLSASAANLAQVSQQMVTVAVVVFGTYLITAGELSMGALIGVVILASRAVAPMAQLAGLATRFNQAYAAYQSVNQIMQLPIERPPGKVFVTRPVIRGDIDFDNVSFNYPNQDFSALDRVSFRIKAGEKVAVIGRIGSGKTTLHKLISGLFEASDGAVRVDGADIRQYDPADLRSNIAYVTQQADLFYGSVRENLTMGIPNAEDEAILRAARLAGVTDFVNRHPMGFDMPVGEGGNWLSGGQRQSVALARALLLDAPVLLLDEPTGAMDSGTEELIKRGLLEAMPGKTLVLVTHRASLLELVDRIVVMDNGRVAADGPKEQVVDALRCGRIKMQ